MKTIDLTELQKNIAQERKDLGISTHTLQMSGVHNNVYQKIEGGNLENITLGSLIKYMKCLGYTMKNNLPLRFEKIERVYPTDCL